MKIITRYEKLILFPIGITALVLAVYFFIHLHWWFGIYFLVVWLLTSMLGQSLHPRLTTKELSDGEQYNTARESPEDEPLSHTDSHLFAKAVIGTGLLIGISGIILGLHGGVRWWLAVLQGVICGWLLPVFFVALISLPSWWKGKTSKR